MSHQERRIKGDKHSDTDLYSFCKYLLHSTTYEYIDHMLEQKLAAEPFRHLDTARHAAVHAAHSLHVMAFFIDTT